MNHLPRTLLALICLCSVALCQGRTLQPKSTGQQEKNESLVRLAQTVNANIQALKTATNGSNPAIQSAIAAMESGIQKLNLELGNKNLGRQILVEACFFEFDGESPTNGADKFLKTRWHDATPIPISVTEDDMRMLKKIGNNISSPNILINDGQDATISIAESKKFPYLDRIESGLYQMKLKTVQDGLTFKVNTKITKRGDHQFIRMNSSLIISRIVGTTPCESGALTIGSPVLSNREQEMSLTLAPGKWSITPTSQLANNKKKTLLIAVKATIL